MNFSILFLLKFKYNVTFYLYSFINFSPSIVNSTNLTMSTNSTNTISCKNKTAFYKTLLGSMDIINQTLIPFFFTLLCSLKLIQYIFTARLKIKLNSTAIEMKRLKKDIQFSLNVLLLNIVFVVLNLPVCIVTLMNVSETFVDKYDLLFYLQYACNLFIYLISNKLFRKEFLKMIKLSKRDSSYRVD